MKKIVFICLLILAVNAVLIQTVTSDNTILKNIIRIVILCLMAFNMLITKQRILTFLFILLDISVILLVFRQNSDQLTFIFVFIFVQSLLLIKTRKIEKYLLISSLISLSLVFIFLALGITENRVQVLRNRMTFGTNGVPFFYNLVYGAFSMLMVYSRKYFKRLKLIVTLISILATTYFYVMTDARGGYFSFLSLIVLFYLIPRTEKVQMLRILIALIPEFCLGVSLIETNFANSVYANQILSNRPILLYTFFQKINIFDILFSSSVKAFDSSNVVDNSYIHLLIGGGVFLSITVGYLFFKTILNLYKQKKYVEISFLISTCLYFNTESLMVRVENIFVIYFWYLLIKYSLTKEEVESSLLPV